MQKTFIIYKFGTILLTLVENNKIVAVEFSHKIYKPSTGVLANAFSSYLKGTTKKIKADFIIPSGTTPHQLKVWNEISSIPYGETLSYGEIAHKIGSSPRAVGTACNRNCLPLIIPCHRVVAKNNIGGFAEKIEIKKYLLDLEGANY